MAIESKEALLRFGKLHGFFAEAIANARTEWEPEDPPITVVMSTLGRALASGVQECKQTDLKRVFDLVESLLTDGQDEVKNAVATGFLESLLSESSASKFDFRRIATFLGKQAIRYCREWDKFTGCRTPGIRGE